MKLIILNLPRDFSEDSLTKLFKPHGKITACTIVMDAQTGASKGFGFVEMANEAEAQTAITALNGRLIDQKNKIRVKAAD